MTAVDPVVHTTKGAVRGTWEGASARFLGIPFAKPPVGTLRFQAPVPPDAWSEVRQATAFGATPQRKALAEVTMIPEPSIPGDDILSVNVFTPTPSAAPDGRGLPVLFWIHGGGFVAGSPASPWYDGASFNRDGVILVTASYRLGFDGFGWLPDAPLNRGVLDWLAALEWVRDNIAAFGGDPGRVTIAGQSAGGAAVLTLLALPAAQDLFHGAISVSGALADIPVSEAKAASGRVAEALGVPLSSAGIGSVSEEQLITALGWGWSREPSPIRDSLQQMSHLRGGMDFGPVLDGELHSRPVSEALAAGRGARIPLMLGATRDEFSAPLALRAADFGDMPAAEAVELMGLERTDAAAFAAALPGEGAAYAAGRLVTDRMFRRRVVEVAHARGDAPTWVYDFAWRSPVTGLAEHCLDVPFLFDVLSDPNVTRVAGPAAPQALADEIHNAYVAFVRDGTPGWQATGRALDRVHVWGDGDPSQSSDGYATARLVAEITG